MTAETSTPVVEQTTPSPQDRALLRLALAVARADGWRPRYPKNRRDGQWSWTNPTWPRMLPPVGARRVVFDGRHLNLHRYDGDGVWVTRAALPPTSLRQAVDVLVAVGILPNGLSSAANAGWSAGCIAVASHANAMASLGDGDEPEREAGWHDGCQAVADTARRMAGTPGIQP